ncbi:hypothetical protein GCM10010971_23650 [Silvimonas amylolytica]|uniref:MetA-pathway of phenol degradation n=1 Tax=Silvimonas amylolytica TaxID=449663 RepID=A0ABQ2PMB3_9NEIS|nr:hypothetical protein GCM10010971_23650 [Silvimonas amylolytica]
MHTGWSKLGAGCALAACLASMAWADEDFVPVQSGTTENTLVPSRLGINTAGNAWDMKGASLGPSAYSVSNQWSVVSQPLLSGAHSDLLPGSNPYGSGQDVQNLLLLPAKINDGAWVLGGGTAFLGESTLNSPNGVPRWGAGPSGVMMMQNEQWSWGVEANHIWSYTVPALHGNASTSAVQPFVSFSQRSGYIWSLGSETTYDWLGKVWTVPVSAGLSHMFSVGSEKAMLGVEGKYWISRPDSAPGWGVRLTASMLFPD